MGVLLVLIAALFAGGCVALASAQLMAIARWTPTDLEISCRSLRQLPAADRAAALAERASGWVRELGVRLGEARTPGMRVAATNEVLGEVARALDARAEWPSAAVRMAASSGLLVVSVALLVDAGAVVLILCVSLFGVAAVFASFAARRARVESRARKRTIDELVELCVPSSDLAERRPSSKRARRRSANRS